MDLCFPAKSRSVFSGNRLKIKYELSRTQKIFHAQSPIVDHRGVQGCTGAHRGAQAKFVVLLKLKDILPVIWLVIVYW